MCMEDIRLGRELGPVARSEIIPGGAATLFLQANPKRTRFLVSSGGAATLWLAPKGITPASGVGFALSTSHPMHEFRIEDIGRMVCEEWSAFTVAPQAVTWIDSTLERSQ